MTIKTVNKQENGGVEAEHFEVFVDDNFHYMDEDYRYKAGEFLNYDEALTEAKRIVDEELAYRVKPGMTAEELYDRYITFGEDPFIMPANKKDSFSAWDYAQTQSYKVCSFLPSLDKNEKSNNQAPVNDCAKTVFTRLKPSMSKAQIKLNLIAALEKSGFTVQPSPKKLDEEGAS